MPDFRVKKPEIKQRRSSVPINSLVSLYVDGEVVWLSPREGELRNIVGVCLDAADGAEVSFEFRTGGVLSVVSIPAAETISVPTVSVSVGTRILVRCKGCRAAFSAELVERGSVSAGNEVV